MLERNEQQLTPSDQLSPNMVEYIRTILAIYDEQVAEKGIQDEW